MYEGNPFHDPALEVQGLPHLCDLQLHQLPLVQLASEVKRRVPHHLPIPKHPRQRHKAMLVRQLWDQVVQEAYLDVVDWEVYHVCHPWATPDNHSPCLLVTLPIPRAFRVQKVSKNAYH